MAPSRSVEMLSSSGTRRPWVFPADPSAQEHSWEKQKEVRKGTHKIHIFALRGTPSLPLATVRIPYLSNGGSNCSTATLITDFKAGGIIYKLEDLTKCEKGITWHVSSSRQLGLPSGGRILLTGIPTNSLVLPKNTPGICPNSIQNTSTQPTTAVLEEGKFMQACPYCASYATSSFLNPASEWSTEPVSHHRHS